MTPQQIKAMKMALEALEYALNKPMWNRPKMTVAITALEEALAQTQEPVAMRWLAEMIMSDCGCSTNNERLLERVMDRIDQYERANTPPQRKPLTDEEIMDACDSTGWIAPQGVAIDLARAIEAAHGIKENT